MTKQKLEKKREDLEEQFKDMLITKVEYDNAILDAIQKYCEWEKRNEQNDNHYP